jgi:hypothetical protein
VSVILIDRTGQPEVITASDGSLTVTVPIRIKRRGLRKVVNLPDGVCPDSRPWDATPTPLQLALARGHRWLAMLESGEVKSMKEIARREGVDDSYVSRMVNLTTLAPDIVAAILDETLPPEVTLFELAAGTMLLREEQRGRRVDLSEAEHISRSFRSSGSGPSESPGSGLSRSHPLWLCSENRAGKNRIPTG